MYAIFHQVIIKSSFETIYDNITTQEGLSGWWTKDVEARPEVGFINEFRFGKLLFNKMEITELVPNKKVQWKVVESVSEWVNTSITFEIRQKDDLHVLNFRHEGYTDLNEFFATCNFNWGKYLLSLRKLCETGQGEPFEAKA